MRVATYTTAGGETKVLEYSAGRFTVDGCDVGWATVFEWDEGGVLMWASAETSEWAASLRTFSENPTSTIAPTWFTRLPGWAKILFVLFWPASIPYAVLRMWKRRTWPVALRVVMSVVAAGAMLFLTLLSVATSLPTAETRPATIAVKQAAVPARPESESASRAVQAPMPQSVVAVVPATAVRVIDGDTGVFRFADGTEEKVRFIGVDTPESTTEIEIYGKEASSYTTKALPAGTQVYLEKDVGERDQYGRLLAYVWLAEPTALTDVEIRGKMFNARLVLDGYAQQMTIQPNSKYADLFTTFVTEARTSEKGLWSPSVLAAAAAQAAPKPTPVPAPKPKPKPEPEPEPEPEPQPKSSGGGGTVYITDTGEKYHSAGCSYLSKSKHAISLSEAESDGYTPCSRCDP